MQRIKQKACFLVTHEQTREPASNRRGFTSICGLSVACYKIQTAPPQLWAAEQTARRMKRRLCGPRSPHRPPPAGGSAEGKKKAAPAPARTARRRSRAARSMPTAKQGVLRALLQSMHGQMAERARARLLLAGPQMGALSRVPVEAAACWRAAAATATAT